MKKAFAILFLIGSLFLSADDYLPYSAVEKKIGELKNAYAKLVNVAVFGQSAGGKNLLAVEIGDKTKPTVLIVADVKGYKVDAVRQALQLVEHLCKNYSSLERFSFIVIPTIHPDAYEAYFQKTDRWLRSGNLTPTNTDGDRLFDEDGGEDLNKDGLITQMRMKSIEGELIPDAQFPELLVPADKILGQQGIYKVYNEGIDNDNDGQYNEDGPGGVEINRNFPHQFAYFRAGSGQYPVSEKETRGVIEYILGRPGIFQAFVIDEANNLMKPPSMNEQSKLGSDRVKLPERMALRFGLDPSTEYTIKELIEMASSMVPPGVKVTEEMIATFLGLGPKVNYNEKDMRYLEQAAKEYKELMKKLSLSDSRKYSGEENGSFSQWLYFQMGIPAIALDSFTLPIEKEEKPADPAAITVEKLKAMSSDDFLKLKKEDVEAFLKSNNAPPQFNYEMVCNMVKAGKITPAKMAEFMEKNPPKTDADGGEKSEYRDLCRWLKKTGQEKAILPWQKFNHPQLGEVEIGGIAPYAGIVPPVSFSDEMFKLNSTYITEYLKKAPRIAIREAKAKRLGDGVYEVSFYVVNEGYLPFQCEQAIANRMPFPLLARIDLIGTTLLSGEKLVRIPNLEGKGGWEKVTLTVRAAAGKELRIQVEHAKIGVVNGSVTLK